MYFFRIELFLIKNEILFRLLIRSLLFMMLCEVAFDISITDCTTDEEGKTETLKTMIDKFHKETKKELDKESGNVKIVTKTQDNCKALCAEVERFGIKLYSDCDSACGSNKDEIINELRKETINRINKKLPKDSLMGKVFNDLDDRKPE